MSQSIDFENIGKNPELQDELIRRYLAGTLSDDAVSDLEAYCFVDKDFFRKVQAAERLAGIIREEGRRQASQQAARPPVFRRYLQVAATLALLAVSAFFLLNRPAESPPISQQQPTANNPGQPAPAPSNTVGEDPQTEQAEPQAAPPSPDYAANFEPLPHLEGLLAQHTRSEGAVSGISPTGIIKQGNDIEFAWSAPRHHSEITLVVLNNRNKILLQQVGRSPFLWEKSLEPGRYYWLLEDQEDILFCGVFQVSVKHRAGSVPD